jgi:DNA modification methylase
VPTASKRLEQFVPDDLKRIQNPQTAIPALAKDTKLLSEVEQAIQRIPTEHILYRQDSRRLSIEPESIHLVVTSPPYWTLKEYNPHADQLGYVDVEDYEQFLRSLDEVWERCYQALVPGGRLICVVGDVCLSRRKNNGVHTVVPLHASIQEHCRSIGFTNLAPIIWHKIAKRVLSVISAENYSVWFQQIWNGVTGASTKSHPAPYPAELAERLIRMFSFVGDTVLDPFLGTGTTAIAAARWGRNSVGVEVDPLYFDLALLRLKRETANLFGAATIEVR